MKKLVLLLLGIVWLQPVSAQIYKWKDKDGVVRYSDTPPPTGTKPTTVKVNKSASQPASPISATQAKEEPTNPVVGLDGKPLSKSEAEVELRRQKEMKEKEEKTAKAEKDKADRENCNIARENLRTSSVGGRVGRTNEKGEREFYTDKELSDQIKQAKQAISKYCK